MPYPYTKEFQQKSIPAINNREKPSYLIPGASAALAGAALLPEATELAGQARSTTREISNARKNLQEAQRQYKRAKAGTKAMRKGALDALKKKGWLFAIPLLSSLWVAKKRGESDKENREMEKLRMLQQMMNSGVDNGR